MIQGGVRQIFAPMSFCMTVYLLKCPYGGYMHDSFSSDPNQIFTSYFVIHDFFMYVKYYIQKISQFYYYFLFIEKLFVSELLFLKYFYIR